MIMTAATRPIIPFSVAFTLASWLSFGGPPVRAQPYAPIEATSSDQTVTLTGHDLTIDQLVQIAHQGAKVEISPEAQRHQADALALLLEAAAEGVPIEGFNRRREDDHETAVFEGDPMAPQIADGIAQRLAIIFQDGATEDEPPEVAAEDSVRALMAVRANTLTYAPASPSVGRMLVDFLNDGITPVIASPDGTLLGAHAALENIGAAMTGVGEVHYLGKRMQAADALRQAGLEPVRPAFFDDHALFDTDAAEIASAALMLGDAKRALDWADLIAAMEMDGQEASISALSLPSQGNRPFPWLNWGAARVLDMLKGSYLLAEDAANLPPGRAGPLAEQGSAWQAWGAVRDSVLVGLNSSDQTPAVRVGLSPRESAELSSPQMMRYFVKGGRDNGGKRGFVVPTDNRSPSPLAEGIEAFSIALAVMGDERTTGVDSPGSLRAAAVIVQARQVLDAAFKSLARRLETAAMAMDQRLTENPARNFGPAPTAAWLAYRKLPPGDDDDAIRFLRANSIETYYSKGEPPLGTDAPIPLAQERNRR